MLRLTKSSARATQAEHAEEPPGHARPRPRPHRAAGSASFLSIARLSVGLRRARAAPPTSELEVDELAAAELARQHDGVEARRVEDAADVPGGAGDHVEVLADVLDDLDEQEREDQERDRQRGTTPPGSPGG